jgi:hypothetical protein
MIIGFTNVERNFAKHGMELIYEKNTQTLIFEFECLWSDSRNVESDTTGKLAVKQSYCNWIHLKIIFRTQIMIKLVIWMNLNAQSVCMYQLWCFLILWCSTWLEDSKDYKFEIFGCIDQKTWIKEGNRWVWFNLKMNSIWILTLWHFTVLIDSTLYKLSRDILFVNFGCTVWKLWILQESNKIWFKTLIWNLFDLGGLTHVAFLLAGTSSFGSRIRAVRCKGDWTHQIQRYRFG